MERRRRARPDIFGINSRVQLRRESARRKYLCKLGKGRYVVLRVTDALDVDRFCLFVNRGRERCWVRALDKLDSNVESLQEHWIDRERRILRSASGALPLNWL